MLARREGPSPGEFRGLDDRRGLETVEVEVCREAGDDIGRAVCGKDMECSEVEGAEYRDEACAGTELEDGFGCHEGGGISD